MTANQFHNYSNEWLADEIGEQDESAKKATARLDALKAEAKRRGIEIAVGTHWKITVSHGERQTLDVKGLRELLGDALTPYEKKSPTSTLRISSVFSPERSEP